MAEINDFGDIQESFDYITEALDSMRAQSAMNSGNTDKVLTSINERLESLVKEENADMMKVFLTELKRSLDERHNFVSSKFSEIENSFNEIIEKTQNQLQAHEVKGLFEIIASNLNVFSADFSSQKELISQIGLQIEELRQDDSQTKEILKNISTLKIELEKIGNGFESVIVNLNGNFKELSQTLVKLDTSESLVSLRKDIENVFLSSNAILSTLQVIDRKNRELEEVITHVVTKEDFEIEKEQVGKLVMQNIQLNEYISNLPTQNNFEALTEKIDTSVGVINALKNMLSETGKQNQQMLTAQLDNLETKILNISTEEEFIGFRKELNDFAQGVIQSTNLMRTDLADTNADLKDLLSFLSAMDIKNTFINLSTLSKESENNVIGNISKLGEDISTEIEKNRKITKTDIDERLSEVNEKINSAKKEITENSKLNLASVLEHIQSVINNIFSVKNALHIDNLESAEAIDAKFQDLKEELTTSNNFIVQNAHENMENVVSNVSRVSQEISSAKEDIKDKISNNAKNITGSFAEISTKIEEIKEELNQSSQESFTNLLSIVEDFSKENSDLKTTLEVSSKANSEEVKGFIEDLSEKLNILKDTLARHSETNIGEFKNSVENLSEKMDLLKEHLAKDSEVNFSEIKNSVESLAPVILSVKSGLEQSSNVWLSGLKSNVEALSQEFNVFENNFDIKSQSNLAKIVSLFEDLSKDFNAHKEFLSESAQVNFESVALYIQNLSQKIEEAKGNFKDDLKSNFSQIQNSISILPETIKRNQSVFENENKILLEENSKNIIDIGDRIQSLIEGLAAKENPFKDEVLCEFSELKSGLETIKEDLSQSNQTLEEKVEEEINTNIQNLEESIVEYSEKYNLVLEDLQRNLTESFDLVQQTAQKNGFKLDNSIRETSEIKAEIQSIIDKIPALKNDSSFADLSANINKKFEGILINITQLEEISSTKNRDLAQNVLRDLEEKFESISTNLKTYQNLTTEEIGEFIEELGDKVETIKSQISFAGTDIINALTAKTNEVINWLSPLSEVVNKISETDFEEMIADIKNKIESSYFSITSVMKEDMKKENAEQLERILQDFENLNGKLNDNEFLIEQFASVKDLISNAKSQNTISIDEALETILEKLETISLYSASKGSSDFSKAEEIIEKIDVIEENLLQSQNEMKTAILESVQENSLAVKEDYQTSTQSLVSELIEKTTEFSREKVFEKLDDLQGRILETQDGMKASILEELQENSLAVKEDFQASTQSLVSELIEKTTESSREKVFEKLETLQDKILETQDETKEALLKELKENIDSIKESLSSDTAGVSEEISEEISQKIEKLQESLQSISEEIEEKFLASDKKYKNSAQSLLSEVKTSFYEKVDDSLDDLRSFLEVLQSKKDFSEEFDNIKSEVFDKFSEMAGNFENSKKDFSVELDTVKSEIFDKFSESLENSENNKKNISFEINNLKADVSDKFLEFGNNLDVNRKEFSDEIDSLRTDISVRFSGFSTNLEGNKKEFSDEIDSLKIDISDKISEFSDNFESNKKGFSGEIDSLKADISDKLSEFSDNFEDNKKEFSDEINSVKTEVFEKFSGFSDNLENNKKEFSDEIENLKAEILDKFSESIENSENNKKNISLEIDNLKTDVFDKFSESLEKSENNKKSISSEINNIKSDICNKFSEFADNLEASISSVSIKEDLDGLNAEIETSVNDLLENLYEKLLVALEDNKVTNDIFDKTEEVSRRIEDLKNAFSEDVTEKIADFELNFEKQSNDFSAIMEEIKTSLAEFKESYMDLSLNSTMEISGLLVSVQEKIDNLENKLEEIDLSEKIEAVENKIENLDLSKIVEDFSHKLDELDFNGAIEDSKNEIVNKLDELVLNGRIDDIEDKIENSKNELTNKLDELILNGKVEDIEDKIENSKDEIRNEFETIREKLDSLVVGSDSKMEENVEEIKQMINSQGDLLNKLEKLEELEKLENLPEINDLKNLKTEIEEVLKNFENKLDNLKISSENLGEITLGEIAGRDENYAEDVKNELNSFKEELFSNLVDIFNQISFVEESEDIKDFIQEKSDEIKAEIKAKLGKINIPDINIEENDIKEIFESSLDDNFNNILSSLDMLHEKANSVGGNCSYIVNEIKEVKNQLILAQSESEYSYTLQDVESDIAKLRMALNDIMKSSKEGISQPTGDFEQLNENIMSISTRTNKLLLNSDESYAALKSNLNELRSIVSRFEEKVKYLDNKEPINRIEKKLENVNNFMVSSVKSDKIFNQTFMYLAEWIDRTDEKMANISEKLTGIEDVRKSMLKSSDMEMLLEKFVKKFDKQEEKIKSLEAKIEKLTKKESPKETDIKTIIKEVLNKVEMPEFKSDEKLVKKVDGIDRRLTTLGKNIEKITSYVEE